MTKTHECGACGWSAVSVLRANLHNAIGVADRSGSDAARLAVFSIVITVLLVDVASGGRLSRVS